jgi:Fic family protein
MLRPTYLIPKLPPTVELETVAVLKALAKANRALAELKGRAAVIPNQGILIDTLALQEAKASSEIENIVTTQDELFQAELFPEGPDSAAAKDLGVTRQTAAKYLDTLAEHGFVDKHHAGRANYYINTPLVRLFLQVSGER